MGYWPLDKELIDLCRQYPPRFKAIRAKIAEGADVNTNSFNINIFEEIFSDPTWEEKAPKNKYILRLVELLIKSGFRPYLYDGLMGAVALRSIQYLPQGRYCLEIAEQLMKAGADPRFKLPEKNVTVLQELCDDAYDRMTSYGTVSQTDLSQGECLYRLYLFLTFWPELSIDECMLDWPMLTIDMSAEGLPEPYELRKRILSVIMEKYR